jgi:RNA polymerase sigma-70 factor, ECF subfamily
LADLTIDAQTAARAAATRVARESYGKLVAFLAARDRDIAGAEDALSDALATALAEWPRRGVPENPEGWLIVTARRRRIDAARRSRIADQACETLRLAAEELQAAEDAGPLPDRRLALMFVCAHPAIDESVRAPLMLQTVLGLDAAAIASAFLVAPATMGQRLSRAKAKIRLAGAAFRIPEHDELPERLDAVLQAIYAAFGYGWEQAFADDPRGRNLADEAIWLGRLVASLAVDEPEAQGLLALMLYADSRRAARRDAAGRYVPLAEQEVSRWNAAAIDEAERLLIVAGAKQKLGRFQLEAAIQSAHAARRHGGATDWPAIAALYDALYALTGSKVVAVNRAVATAEAHGEAAGLALLEAAAADGGLDGYQSYWAARAALSARAGRKDEAADAYRRAIGLEFDPATRDFLLERLAALG